MGLLCIDACARERSVSRTWQLADAFLQEYARAFPHSPITVLRLAEEKLTPFLHEDVLYRESLIDRGDFGHPMFRWAREFAAADHIAVAAPYWDLSFPAILKVYIENIFVRNLTFQYTVEGEPRGLCRGKRLLYVTTAGSPIGGDDWGFGYIRAAVRLLGVKEFDRVSAEGIDIKGRDVQAIMEKAIDQARQAAWKFS